MMVYPTSSGLVVMPKLSTTEGDFIRASYLTRRPATGPVPPHIEEKLNFDDIHVFPCNITIDPAIMNNLRVRCPRCLKGVPAANRLSNFDLYMKCPGCRFVYVNVFVRKEYAAWVMPYVVTLPTADLIA